MTSLTSSHYDVYLMSVLSARGGAVSSPGLLLYSTGKAAGLRLQNSLNSSAISCGMMARLACE